MRTKHREIQQWIKENHSDRFIVAAEIDGQNRLPDWERHWYQPDVVLRDRQGEIRYIIEVEGDPVRKAIVGASVLADYSIAALNQRTRPILIFVIYSEQGIRQIRKFAEKLEITKKYCTHLEDVQVHPEAHFKELGL